MQTQFQGNEVKKRKLEIERIKWREWESKVNSPHSG
jgi:hypothetical protein